MTLDTDLTVANGGTGASTVSDGFVLLGNGTSAIQALDVTTDGAIIIGDGTTDPTTLTASLMRGFFLPRINIFQLSIKASFTFTIIQVYFISSTNEGEGNERYSSSSI